MSNNWWERETSPISYERKKTQRSDFSRCIINTQNMANRTTILHPLYESYNSIQKFCTEILNSTGIKQDDNGNYVISEKTRQAILNSKYKIDRFVDLLKRISLSTKQLYVSLYKYQNAQPDKISNSTIYTLIYNNLIVSQLHYSQHGHDISKMMSDLYSKVLLSSDINASNALSIINQSILLDENDKTLSIEGKIYSLTDKEYSSIKETKEDILYLKEDLEKNSATYNSEILKYYNETIGEFSLPTVIDSVPQLLHNVRGLTNICLELLNNEQGMLKQDEESILPKSTQIINIQQTLNSELPQSQTTDYFYDAYGELYNNLSSTENQTF